MNARWLELVLRASGQDGATAAAAELEAEAVALCADGVAGACSFPSWGTRFSPTAAHVALSPECDRGDAVSCLVSGWALGQEPWGTWSQRMPTAVDARLLVEQACALDLPRGCVEVARALFHGVGSTARPNKARERLAPLCRAKEGSACAVLGTWTAEPNRRRDLLARASDLGFSPALRDLALLPQTDAIVFHEAACLTGVGASCRDLAALDAARQRTALEEGCARQHLGSCTDLAVLRFAEGDEDAGLAALDELCDHTGPSEPCARAELLRMGTPARTQLPGVLSEEARERLGTRLEEGVRECYHARLARGEASGEMPLFVQVAPDGRIDGAAGAGPVVDPPLQRCLYTAARDLDAVAPHASGAALVQYDLFLGHRAEVRFRPDPSSEILQQEQSVIHQLAQLEPALEACALLDPLEVAPIAVDVRIKRSGRVVVVGIPQSSEVPAVDDCAAQVLRSAHIVPVQFSVEGLVLVQFLQALRSGDPEER